ncbi:cysteinyl-tRNA synthetase, partial [Coemansia sp. RSA 2598]
SDSHLLPTRQPLTKSTSRSTLAPERNDYTYMLRERHSADNDSPGHTPTAENQPQAGKPYSFHDRLIPTSAPAPAPTIQLPAAPGPAPAQSMHTPSTRQSQASIATDFSTVPMKHSSSQQLASSILKKAGSALPRKSSKDHVSITSNRPSSSSVASSAAKWFRRSKTRSAGKDTHTPSSNYQLDMNFSDLGNFVNLAKVRRPSVTSSMGTTDSAAMSIGCGAGDSGRDDGANNSIYLAASDAVSLNAGDKRRHYASSPSVRPHRRSIGSGSSPMLKEAIVAGSRSVASSLKGDIAREPSLGSMANTDTSSSQKSEAVPWPNDYSWRQRSSSSKSRPAAVLHDDVESSSEYAGSLNDHGSVRSAPTFEDKQPLMHFTDPWAADRRQRQTLHMPSIDGLLDVPPDTKNHSLGSMRGPLGGRSRSGTDEPPLQDGSGGGAGSQGIVPGVEYPPRKSEPWAPPESWAVLPTALEGADEAGVATGVSRELVSDGDGASSDSDLEEDTSMYSMRIYKEDSTFGTFHCRLSTTTAEFMQMAAKKFFIPDITRYCLYMQKANGLDRTLTANERPANILKKYLEQMGYRPEDNITLQGREDNSYLCKFSLFKAAIPRVSPNMEVEVSSFHYVDLRARKLQTVPVFLYAHANKIVSLNMSKNPGLNFPADFVQLCGNLRELRLSTCQFSRFPNSIQYCQHLSFLDLSGNDIKRMRHAPFSRLVQLTTLMLRNNRLVELPESLAQLSSLRVLNVSNNNLPVFPKVVTRIKSLEELDISLNRIPAIPDEISLLVNLVKLNIMGNSLAGNLPNGLGCLARLEELDVRQNRLQDLSVISELAGLRLLYTESNMVTRADMELACAASVSLRSNKLTQCRLTNPAHTLVFLDLSRNQLTELPSDTFVHLPMLERLVLDSNHIVTIPSSVGYLSNLVHLSCANNILSLIPIELTRLEKLTTLDLHNNNLKMLPPEIWLMPRLNSLNLSSNLLEQFPHPSMLESARRQQGASGSVRAVAAAAAAAAAAAQRNGTKTPVSNRVAQGMHMSSMSLPNTRQTSPMVRGASETGIDAHNHGADSLHVSSTERMRNRSTDSGRIVNAPSIALPTPIKRFSVSDPPPLSLCLRELRMGDNNLDDEVFMLMAFLPELRILNLSYNELYDLPPSAMAHMRKVNELYLSGTQISTIPEEEPNTAVWRSLRLLNINGNKLQTLPSWLAKIHGLAVLDVGSNVLKYNITNWRYDWNWNWNTGLKYLNFSYNERFEIKGAHLHTKVFHDHAKLMGNNAPSSGTNRDLFNFVAKEPPKSDCVSDFYQLTDLRILGLLQLTIMVPLPDEMPNRRIRTTDPIKQVKYGIADTLGQEDRVSAWDLAKSRLRMTDDECLFGLFHARESSTSSSAISKYLCDNFSYLFREELEKIADQIQAEETDSRITTQQTSAESDSKKAVNFAESPTAGTGDDVATSANQLSDKQIQAALRRTFLTLNKDLGTHNRQLIAAATAAEAYAARTARVPTQSVSGDVLAEAQPALHGNRLTSTELNMPPGRSSYDPKGADTANGDYQGGSTAVVAYLHGRTLHVANVGDALGVVSRRGTPIMLSKRHDPYDVSEIMRIRSIGGYITQQGKVQGQTDITRAFGYFHLLPYVNADPTIKSLELTEADEFLIMANRPVWDVITPQIAVDIARKHRRDPRLAAARVRDHVIAYGVTKSIMVMVIGFGPMFAKNTGRPMRGFSVRDSIHPGVSDHRSKYAMTRRMSRSPSSVMAATFGPRASVSQPMSASEIKGIPGMFPIPGAHQTNPLTPTQQSMYDFSDDFDDFSPVQSSRARRQRDRDVNARPGDSTLARLEREVPPPIGEVVLVFTDVKNSTIQWETNQVAMRSAIKVHNGIMRRMLRSIGGYEVKTEGDAFMVSFPTVASALHWCLAVQMTFLTADWPQEIIDSPHGYPIYWPPEEGSATDGSRNRKSTLLSEGDGRHLIYRGLRVRMGMHLGSPVSEEDPITRRMDYFGPMVNRASRISGAADGGQVYVSQDVMDEVYAILGIFETADHNGITDMRQIIDEPSLARDVQALKNLGLSAIQVGEIKLKGLESPELVSMVYPAALRGRIDMQIQEEEEQQRLKQKQQQQQQHHKKKKQDWASREASITNAKLTRQNGGSSSMSADGIPSRYTSAGQVQRDSIDEGSLLEYSESGSSSHAQSALSSPRESFSKQGLAQTQQRTMRELSMELVAAPSKTDARSRMRQIGDMPLWSAPVTRRSVSLLQSQIPGPDRLESIGEDAAYLNDDDDEYLIPDAASPIAYGRGSKSRTLSRVPSHATSPRPVMYMPPYYLSYLHGSTGTSPAWSRQGSVSYYGAQPLLPGQSTHGSFMGSRQHSRGSIDTALAVRSIGSSRSSVDMRPVDLVHLDLLHRLIYRLQILAVESDTETVRPSFEFFIAHHAQSHYAVPVHRASTVSVSAGPLVPRKALIENAQQRTESANTSLHKEDPGSSKELGAEIPTAEIPSAALELPCAQQEKAAQASSGSRPRSASPTLIQNPMAASPPAHRHTQSAQPSVPLSQLMEMAEKADQLMNIPLALNEPPVPLYLSEEMTPNHLLVILAMLVRQIECAVSALEDRHAKSDNQDETSQSPGHFKRNDSKIDDEIVTDGALRLALEKVASEGCSGLSDREFEWTQEHVVRALEAYANQIERH